MMSTPGAFLALGLQTAQCRALLETSKPKVAHICVLGAQKHGNQYYGRGQLLWIGGLGSSGDAGPVAGANMESLYTQFFYNIQNRGP